MSLNMQTFDAVLRALIPPLFYALVVCGAIIVIMELALRGGGRRK